MQNKNFLFVIIVILVLGGIFLFAGRDRNAVEEVVKAEPASVVELNGVDQTIPTDEDTVMDGEVKTFEVGGGSFYFTPNEIKLTKGDTVRIVFTNEGGTHDWSINEFDARTDLTQTAEIAEVTFVAEQFGTFEFYCSVGNHRELGMVGTLIVEPSAE